MNALIDLPFAVPTVVTGVMLVVLFGPSSVVGTIMGRYGWAVIYHQPGIVLALLFVTYPFVIRSVQPVLMEMDRAEEEAASTLGAGALDDVLPGDAAGFMAFDRDRVGLSSHVRSASSAAW